MAKVLYLEPLGGIAGDMFLAAGIDLGVSVEQISRALAGLGLHGWRLHTEKAFRHNIGGTHLAVQLDERDPHAHRPLSEISARIRDASTLSEGVKARALAIFALIGEAEAKIHGTTVEEVHFHEVGAVDSIVDVVGAAVVLELLGNPKVYCAPPPLGSGTVETAHGTMPIPAPATVEILRGIPVRYEGFGERTTPTGAALVRALCQVSQPPELAPEKVGYGVGSKDWPDRPNLLRATLGHTSDAPESGTYVVEANLDDCSPQLLGGLLEGMLELGALDAYAIPATMKKSRPGHLFGVVVTADMKDAVLEALLAETTTIGARFYRVDRLVLDRHFEEVQTPYGAVRIKVAMRGPRVMNAYPEYEDLKVRAKEAGVPVKVVFAAALTAYADRDRGR